MSQVIVLASANFSLYYRSKEQNTLWLLRHMMIIVLILQILVIVRMAGLIHLEMSTVGYRGRRN